MSHSASRRTVRTVLRVAGDVARFASLALQSRASWGIANDRGLRAGAVALRASLRTAAQWAARNVRHDMGRSGTGPNDFSAQDGSDCRAGDAMPFNHSDISRVFRI